MSLIENLKATILPTTVLILWSSPYAWGQGNSYTTSTRSNQPFDERQLFLDQLHEAHRQIVKADLSLITQMHFVASRIKVYLKNQKNSPLIPDTDERNKELADFLSSNLPQNPYRPEPEQNKDRVKVTLKSISKQQLAKLRQKQPADWQGRPGEISVIHNGYDLFVIWGANYRGEPVKKHQLKPRIKPGSTAKIISIQLKF